jgi:hypothetical protein
LPIGEYLFASRYEFDDIKQCLAQDEDERAEKARKVPKITQRSAKLVDKMKLTAFVEIFETLIATVEFHKQRQAGEAGQTGSGGGKTGSFASPTRFGTADENTGTPDSAVPSTPSAAPFILSENTLLDTALADASLLKPDIASVVSPVLLQFEGQVRRCCVRRCCVRRCYGRRCCGRRCCVRRCCARRCRSIQKLTSVLNTDCCLEY